ncbi:MAG: NADH:ubiquinone reductase (Na(+)-transporting) subunit A [Proteobacteria bacterium]|nr:MAG: NADH:ubiquinone reductase (Na(+)-transporting) subunit A [Pseudomonadota bacterium]
MMKIVTGLDVPISGRPIQSIDSVSPTITQVALLGRDFHGLRPSMRVRVGDKVKIGQTLFTDKKNPGVNFTSPGAGTVSAINRGEKRVLQSVVIDLDEDEVSLNSPKYAAEQLDELEAVEIRRNMQESGAWTAFRTRPYSKVPQADAEAKHIYVNAMDTRPLAADPSIIIAEREADFQNGLKLLSKLTSGNVFVCHETSKLLPQMNSQNVLYREFSGVHPAGLVGTHMHMLEPAGLEREMWHINYQDVIALGSLFTTGQCCVDRVISLAGPSVKNPRLLRVRAGACISEIVSNELEPGEVRAISGSVLGGYRAADWSDYLGRYSLQVSVIPEGETRKFLHWVNPTLDQFSVMNVFFNSLNRAKDKLFPMSSTQNGSPRAMVPIGNFEQVMPLDILPTQLLRALLVRDTETAKQLGCMELDEEDLALCTFVCHGKYEYGPALRACLEMIERDG